MKNKKNGKEHNEKAGNPVQKEIIKAAGGLLWRETKRGRELAIVHRPYYDDWVLPKGKLDEGEGWEQAAVREVVEETCCTAELGDYAGCVSYLVNDKPKLVLFWHMSLLEEREFVPDNETDRLRWFTVDEVLEKLDYATERTLISRSNFSSE